MRDLTETNTVRRAFLRACAALLLGVLPSAHAQSVRIVPLSIRSVATVGGGASAGTAHLTVDSFGGMAQAASIAPGLLPAAVAPVAPSALLPAAVAPVAPSALPYPSERYAAIVPAKGTLGLPGGGVLRPELALSEKRRQAALLSASLPEQGLLVPLPGGSLDLWPRLLNMRMDVVALDEKGVIQKIAANLGHPGRDVPWNKVDPIALKGSRLLLLPAGKAGLLGLREGSPIAGTNVPAPSLNPPTLSKMILSGNGEAWSALLAYLRENPSTDLDGALSVAKSNLRSMTKDEASRRKRELVRFLDQALADRMLPQKLRDAISWHAPLRWARDLWKHPSTEREIVIDLKFGSWTHQSLWRISPVFTTSMRLGLLPLDLMRTTAHELGHLIAVDLVGGKTSQFRVFPSGNGHVESRTPDGWKRAAVFLAGPISQMLVGSVLFLGGILLLSSGAVGGVLLTLGAMRFLKNSINGGASTDWPGAAQALGFYRLALEMRHRWKNSKETSYLRMFLRLLREARGTKCRGGVAARR